MSVQQTEHGPRSRLTSALAGKIVIPEQSGFGEMSMSARTRPAIDAVVDVAGADAQLPTLNVAPRHLFESMMGAPRV